MNNEELRLETILSTPDGSGLATKGKELEQKWNVNTDRIATNINAIWAALEDCVVSNNIVAIRINPLTNKPEYTYGPLDGTEEWFLLAAPEWTDIIGNPMLSTSLAAILNGKASITELNDLDVLVHAINNTVDSHSSELIEHNERLNDHENRITECERVESEMGLAIANKVDVLPGQYLMLMHNTVDNNVDFSVDGGTTWKPIMSSIRWGDLKGDPTDSIEFATYIHDLVGSMIDDVNFDSITTTVQDWLTALEVGLRTEIATKVEEDVFNAHKNDNGNPHNVTKEQIGLSEVENLNPYDLPISNATMEAINAIQAKDITFSGLTGFEVVDRLTYDNSKGAGSLNPSALYFVSRLNTGIPKPMVYMADTVLVNTPGSGYVNGEIVTLSLNKTNLSLQLDISGGATSVSVVQQGKSDTNFAGTAIPVEGGSGTGLTIDITTKLVEEE